MSSICAGCPVTSTIAAKMTAKLTAKVAGLSGKLTYVGHQNDVLLYLIDANSNCELPSQGLKFAEQNLRMTGAFRGSHMQPTRHIRALVAASAGNMCQRPPDFQAIKGHASAGNICQTRPDFQVKKGHERLDVETAPDLSTGREKPH